MNNEDVQRNRIGDAAAADMLQFYREQLDNDVQGSARYEAHLYLGLLAWRAGNQPVMEEHLPTAANLATERFVERSEEQPGQSISPFEFMIPAFLTFTFGSQQDREALTRVRRSSWAGRDDDEFASVTELLDLVTRSAAAREFDKADVEKLARVNDSEKTHRFYQPWIAAFAEALYAIIDGDRERLEQACATLGALHREEALEGDWQLHLESVMDFWTSTLLVTAKSHGLEPTIDSPYVPRL